MPLYEYDCTTCGCRFEILRRIDQMDEVARCLSCHSKEAVRVISKFNVVTGRAIPADPVAQPPPFTQRTGPYGMVEITDNPAPGGGIRIAPGSENILIDGLYSEHPGPAVSLPTDAKNVDLKHIRRKT